MTWTLRAGVQYWVGEFPEPADTELAPYGYRHPNDVDELAVERACKGEPPAHRLTVAERVLIVRRLHAAGLRDGDISRLSGINREVVGRIRRRNGLPPIPPVTPYIPANKSRKASA